MSAILWVASLALRAMVVLKVHYTQRTYLACAFVPCVLITAKEKICLSNFIYLKWLILPAGLFVILASVPPLDRL